MKGSNEKRATDFPTKLARNGNPLAAAVAKRAERQAAGLKVTYTPIERALDDPTSKTKAIAAKCWDCQGGNADPCVSWRIGNCAIKACPLHPVRPHRRLYGSPTPRALLQQFDGVPS